MVQALKDEVCEKKGISFMLDICLLSISSMRLSSAPKPGSNVLLL